MQKCSTSTEQTSQTIEADTEQHRAESTVTRLTEALNRGS